MKKLLTWVVFLFAFSVSLWGATDWQRLIGKVSGSLVNVVMQESVDDGESAEVVSMGSGVVFQKEAESYYFATINVNLDGLEHKKCYAVLSSGQQFPAKFIGKNESVNFAVYEISPNQSVETPFLNKNEVALGEDVCVLSAGLFPEGGLQVCVSAGVVSKTGVFLQNDVTNSQIFEVDANVTAGGMGGVAINNSGQMVGFVIDGTSFLDGGRLQQPLVLSSLSFASLASGFISDYNSSKSSGVAEELEPLFPIENGFYGLILRDLNPRDLKNYGLPSTDGVLIEAVKPGSVGAKAGFAPDDLIIGAEKYKVANVATLKKIEKRVKSKGQMSIILYKDGKREIIVLKLEDETPVASVMPGLVSLPKSTADIVVSSLSEAQRGDLDFGVVISSVASGSAYEKAGLNKGDVIQEIQDVLVESKQQFEREFAKVKKGDRVLFYVVHADGSYGYVTVDI